MFSITEMIMQLGDRFSLFVRTRAVFPDSNSVVGLHMMVLPQTLALVGILTVHLSGCREDMIVKVETSLNKCWFSYLSRDM